MDVWKKLSAPAARDSGTAFDSRWGSRVRLDGSGKLTILAVVVLLFIPRIAPAAGIEAYEPSPDDRFEVDLHGVTVTDPWWITFEDDELTSLVERGLEGNRDLAAAWGRVEQAEARMAQSLSPVLPALSFDVQESSSPYSSLGFQFGGLPRAPGEDGDDPEVYHSGSAMLNIRVPLSLWNGTLSSHRAGRYDRAASAGDAEALALALASRIGRAYFDVVAAREQTTIIEAQIETHRALLELTELRYEQSDASALDVLQQRQQLAATEALLPQARATLRTQTHQLTALLGRNSPVAVEASSLPDLPPMPGIGTPADLLESRPDLRASEAQVKAARLRNDAAIGALTPSLDLNGSVGTQLIYIEELDTQETWGLGATLSFPLFQGTRNWAALVEARAGHKMATDAHSQRVLQAIQDVENAAIREVETQQQLDAQRAQLEAAQLSFDESRRHYESGLASYLSVLTAMTSKQQAELSVLATRRSLFDARIRLHESLGGIWTDGLSADAGDR